MYEFSQIIFEKHNIEVTECLTITGLAVKIFLTNHYPKKSLPLLTKPDIYKDIKNAYFGGLSEVYRGYGENLYYYDVNSLYPYAALNDMVGVDCTWIDSYTEDERFELEKDNLFGFFYCEVKAKDGYLGLLPVRHQSMLTYPVGEFSG